MLGFKVNIVISAVLLFALLFSACATPAPAPTPETEHENQITITDRTGRKWDVTHARDIYDMNPGFFNYGLGIGVIPSVDTPVVLEEGDPDYPDSDSRRLVFGVDHNGEQRAYSVNALRRHEVFNDTFPGESDQYLSVAF
jgi:hypothetical protein